METRKQAFCLHFFVLSDSGGIQTHNLLIRSQMLYSVELRNLISDLRVQRYALFFIPPNFSGTFLKKSVFSHDYTRFMIVLSEF